MKPLFSDGKEDEEFYNSMDSDNVITNLLEDIKCLKEDVERWENIALVAACAKTKKEALKIVDKATEN